MAMNLRRNFPRGFTLVEVLMAMLVAIVVTAAIWAAVVSGQHSSAGIETKVTTNQDARAALELMAMEVRMASFNPRFTDPSTNLWVDVSGANCTFGPQVNRGIQRATARSITVEMDINGSVVCGDADNEIINYDYDVETRRITRTMIRCNAGARTAVTQTLLGPVSASVRTVRVINGAVPVFRYYNPAGAELSLDGHPERIPEIRRIEIALVVESEEVDPSSGQPRRLSYSTSVIPRNHGVVYN